MTTTKLIILIKTIFLVDSRNHLEFPKKTDKATYEIDITKIAAKSLTCFCVYTPPDGSKILLFIVNIKRTKPKIMAIKLIMDVIRLKDEKTLFSSSAYFLWKRIKVEDIPKVKIETNETNESAVVFSP